MEEQRVWGDDDPATRAGDPPAEIDIVAKQRQAPVEPAQRIEDVATDQHARRADRQNLADAVVLTLVVLAKLETGFTVAGPSDRDAHLQQTACSRPGADPASDDGDGRVREGNLAQLLERLRSRRAVVVEQPHPLVDVRFRDRSQCIETNSDRATESARPGSVRHPIGTDDLSQELTRGVGRAGVDRDEAVRQPRAGLERPGELRIQRSPSWETMTVVTTRRAA